MSPKEKKSLLSPSFIPGLYAVENFFPYLIHPIIRPHSNGLEYSKHPFLSVTLGQPRDVTLTLKNSTDSFTHMRIAILSSGEGEGRVGVV